MIIYGTIVKKRSDIMSPGLIKMWISLFSVASMFSAVLLIYISRHRAANKAVKIVTALFAYTFLFLSGFLVLAVLVGSPS